MSNITLINASVIDGSGAEPYRARIDIAGERIVSVTPQRGSDETGAGANVQPLRGDATVWTSRSTAAAAPVRIVIDPQGVYTDVDRSNNTWTAMHGQ